MFLFHIMSSVIMVIMSPLRGLPVHIEIKGLLHAVTVRILVSFISFYLWCLVKKHTHIISNTQENR